jgi:hypothetical protein
LEKSDFYKSIGGISDAAAERLLAGHPACGALTVDVTRDCLVIQSGQQ